MSNETSLFDYLSEWSAALVIAMVGGLAKLLHSGEVLTARKVFAGLFLSGFCAVIVAFLMGEYGFSRLMRAAGIGMSGWAGPVLLPYATERLKRVVDKLVDRGGVVPPGGTNG